MKSKLTVALDKTLIEFGKACAAKRGTSLSRLIESNLRSLQSMEVPRFSHKWRGQFADSDQSSRRDYLEARFQ